MSLYLVDDWQEQVWKIGALTQVDVTKRRQHSIEFAMGSIHETYKSKHNSGRNFEKKKSTESWTATTGTRPGWLAYLCPDTIPGYTMIQNFHPDAGCWPFQKFCQFCPDWLLAFFKISTKSVRIVTKPPLPLPGVLLPLTLGGLTNPCASLTHLVQFDECCCKGRDMIDLMLEVATVWRWRKAIEKHCKKQSLRYKRKGMVYMCR